MKHIAIGDIHGRGAWQQIDTKRYDKVIFMGDYADSPDLSDMAILENLKKIISLKKRHPEKVELLLGNHDAHYLHYPNFQCSGFRNTMLKDLSNLYRKNAELFRIAFQKGNYLFTHAGVTNNWYEEVLRIPVLRELIEKEENLAAGLNQIERSKFRDILYDVGIDRGGFGFGGPLWADVKETFTDTLHNYHQVVGHTKAEEIRTVSYTDRSITYTDVLTTKFQFYEIDI